MQYQPHQDPATIENASGRGGSAIPTKSTVILIRWPVVLISSSLILLRPGTFSMAIIWMRLSPSTFYLMLDCISSVKRLFVASNSTCRWSDSTLVLTASLMISGQVETSFSLAYFLLIICCTFENPRMIAIVSFVAPFAYAGIFFNSDDFHPGNYLQLAFLFVVGLFYGHFSKLVRAQQTLKERAEQRNLAKTELLNILSREIKTPLTIVASYAQELKISALGPINPGQEQALSKVLRQADNLENIVNVILESASVETCAVLVQRNLPTPAKFASGRGTRRNNNEWSLHRHRFRSVAVCLRQILTGRCCTDTDTERYWNGALYCKSLHGAFGWNGFS